MPASEPHVHQWKSVYTTNSEPIAYLIAGKLENEGIQAVIRKESAGSAYGIVVGLLGKVDVLVPADDAERALDIIGGEDESAEFIGEDED